MGVGTFGGGAGGFLPLLSSIEERGGILRVLSLPPVTLCRSTERPRLIPTESWPSAPIVVSTSERVSGGFGILGGRQGFAEGQGEFCCGLRTTFQAEGVARLIEHASTPCS